ncbi:MAG TPA: class I SAM-dependent methyltransferase [Elusimicrobiota bacterium]|nr:class I SAM-dependent methyltransferase [Elusimicrobiota bacterium]
MKENEIRPQALFDEYLKIAREDISHFFSDKHRFVEVPCPACDSSEHRESFVKDGFRYVECSSCKTLYTSPRPTQEDFGRFYRESRSSRFWAEHFYKETESARRDKIFRPRALDVAQTAHKYFNTKSLSIVDIGSGYGTFLEELRNTGAFDPIEGIEPSPDLASVCEKKGFKTFRSSVEDVKMGSRFDIATNFELFEHLFSPRMFLQAVHQVLKPGGILYMTTLSGQGFDLLLLRERSKSISPPHHINFINPESLVHCLNRAGFDVLEISTPGKLDVDIVYNIGRETPVPCDPFTHKVVFESNDQLRENYQLFLQNNRLSSHIRAIARKRTD